MSESHGPYKGKGETVDVVDDRVNQSDTESSEEDSDEPKYKDKEWLYHQYHVLKNSQKDIAAECGVSHSTISNWIEKNGIEKRPLGEVVSTAKCENPLWRNREWLYSEYIVAGKSTREIAEKAGTGKTTINRWLGKHDIPKRENGEDPWVLEKPYTNKSWLRREYVHNGKSTHMIAEELDVSPGTILRWLDEHKIKIRSKKEAGAERAKRSNAMPKTLGSSGDDDEHTVTTNSTGASSYTGPSSGIDASWSDFRERETVGTWVPYHDEDWLREKYHHEGLSQTEISDLCDCHISTISNWMKKHGIETRGNTKDSAGD